MKKQEKKKREAGRKNESKHGQTDKKPGWETGKKAEEAIRKGRKRKGEYR